MNSEMWNPSETDRICAGKGYVKYALGVIMLNDPERIKSVFGVNDIDNTNTHQIYDHASSIVRAGLAEVIRYSNQPSLRSALIKMENTFEDALPNILTTVDYAFDSNREQLDSLDTNLKLVRPMPLTNQVTYGNICHSRIPKQDPVILMDGFMLAEVFADIRN